MTKHLSEKGVSMYVIGDATLDEQRHAEECPTCRARIATLVGSLSDFRGAVRNWSDRSTEPNWTVLTPADPLERMLLPDVSWRQSFWSGVRELFQPAPAAPDITSKPVLVKDIWGQYGRQKKSWVMSFALQFAVVGLLVGAASNKTVQRQVTHIATLIMPADIDATPPQAPPRDKLAGGGGGGGDRSPLAASKGRAPKIAPRQFTPPAAVLANLNPRLTMEPSIVAPPDIRLPDVNMAQYGDPLGKLGPASNGPGSGGGIGSGQGGGVGSGRSGGYGPGEGGGVGGTIYRVGGGISAPALIAKVEPEYSEEARKAKYQGTVLLYIEVDPSGRAQNIRVARSLGLGLDEKAIEAVKKWKFKPGLKDGKPVSVAATIEVNFRLL